MGSRLSAIEDDEKEGSDQGDRICLLKIAQKSGPTHFCQKIITFTVRKIALKFGHILYYSKHCPKKAIAQYVCRRKFAQSGHPGRTSQTEKELFIVL
jgi:hypothetical protein